MSRRKVKIRVEFELEVDTDHYTEEGVDYLTTESKDKATLDYFATPKDLDAAYYRDEYLGGLIAEGSVDHKVSAEWVDRG